MHSMGIQAAFGSWYGALVMSIIGVMSVYMVALVIVRWFFFRHISVDSQKLLNETQLAMTRNDAKQLGVLRTIRPTDSPIKILIGIGLANTHFNSADLAELLSVTRVRQRERLSKGLAAFGTMATIAPFVGLLGTVVGIVECFSALAQSGAAGPNVVASGVAEALWATAAGLVVAIPSVVAFNVFKGKVGRVVTDMEVVSRELVLMLRSGDKHSKVRSMDVKEA